MQKNDVFPFTAFVGEETAKRALLVNLIDNSIGGVLLIGSGGSGKKTIARSLRELVPDVDAVKGCPFSCDPLQVDTLCTWCKQQGGRRRVSTHPPRFMEYRSDLTKEDISGHINFGNLVRKTVTPMSDVCDEEEIGLMIDDELSYIPGAAPLANRGVFFIPDAEKLDDDFADLIVRYKSLRLGSVEEEGVRFEFPTGFFLLATTTSLEKLNPRIKESLTLHIHMQYTTDMEKHGEIVDRVQAFEKNPSGFMKSYEGQQNALRQKINRAARFSPRVTTPDNIWTAIESIGEDFGLGERETLAIERISRALCAYERRQKVTSDDVALATEMLVPYDALEKFFI